MLAFATTINIISDETSVWFSPFNLFPETPSPPGFEIPAGCLSAKAVKWLKTPYLPINLSSMKCYYTKRIFNSLVL